MAQARWTLGPDDWSRSGSPQVPVPKAPFIPRCETRWPKASRGTRFVTPYCYPSPQLDFRMVKRRLAGRKISCAKSDLRGPCECGGRDRDRTGDPLLAKHQTRLHPLFLSLQLLTFPTNRGLCFRSKANPDRLKTTRSCTVRVQSAVPNDERQATDKYAPIRKTHNKLLGRQRSFPSSQTARNGARVPTKKCNG